MKYYLYQHTGTGELIKTTSQSEKMKEKLKRIGVRYLGHVRGWNLSFGPTVVTVGQILTSMRNNSND